MASWVTNKLTNSVDSVYNASALFLTLLSIPPIPPHCNLAFYHCSSDGYSSLLTCLSDSIVSFLTHLVQSRHFRQQVTEYPA